MNKLIILFLVIVMVTLSGLDCKSVTSKLPFGKKDLSDLPSEEKFKKGTDGLVIKFDGIMKEVPEDSIIQIPIQIKNLGASDIREAALFINTGDYATVQETDGFTIISEIESISDIYTFPKRGLSNPDGYEELLFIKAKTLSSGAKESVNVEIKAIACYDYQTHARADICIDTQKYKPGRVGPRACEVKDVSLSGGQGGPLSVESVKVDILYNDADTIIPYFEVKIVNKGDGSIFLPQSLNDPNVRPGCLSSLGNRMNRAQVSATFAGTQEKLDCDTTTNNFYKEVNFKKEAVIVACQAQAIPTNKAAYETPLDIYIDYGYTISEKISFKIKNIRAGSCAEDFPFGSKCNDLEGTDCGAKGFVKEPVKTRDCDFGCCKWMGIKNSS